MVSHEAPSSHPHGFAVIDALAEACGASLIVHGHHHQAYEALLPNGIRVRGLGDAADENERQLRVELPVLLNEYAPNSPQGSDVERLAMPEAFLQCELGRMKRRPFMRPV